MTNLEARTLGPYRLEYKLGEGGAATVYRAYQPSMERHVAIKVLKLELAAQDPAFLERFTREARIVAQLQHPHILPVIDFGQTDDLAYIVMVLLEGGTLRHFLREHGPLPLDTCAFIVAQIASALDRAHSRGVIHRDLKPENILMDEDQNVYLTDFGIARILDSARRLTVTGTVLGTPHYLAPETARGHPADERSDTYALGVMLYEMAVGQLPFQGETPFNLIYQHITAPPPPPRTLKPDLPETVERVLLKALAKDPAARYQTPLELAEAFVDALPQTPVASPQAEEKAGARPIGTRAVADSLLDALPEVLPTSTPGRVVPQRASGEEQIIINNRPDDPIAAVPLPNNLMHYALRALEEVAGLQAAEIILRFAGLENLLDEYPPNNLKFDRGYTFRHYSALNHTMLSYFGATGRAAVMHIGRLSSRYLVMDSPLFGFTSAALRIMPTAAALRLSLNKMADGWRNMWQPAGIDFEGHLIERDDFFLWGARHCPCCAGKRSNVPICWILDGGFIEAGVLVKGRPLRVKQIAARSLGDPYCVWRIEKKLGEKENQ